MGEQVGWLSRWWRSFVVAPLRQAEEEQRAFLASPRSRDIDWRVLTVLITTALVLAFQRYFLVGRRPFSLAMGFLRAIGLEDLARWWTLALGNADEYRTRWQLYWAIGSSVTYLVLPALIVKLAFRQRLADYGLKLGGAFKDAWVYGVMVLIMGPLIWLASADRHFQETYPFIDVSPGMPLWPIFWTWELAYTLQFLSLEFFFRGFILHGLRHRFGPYAIPVMMVPYCMIHFSKPLAETLGAILAGLALGFMSLKTRSVILGAAIHVTVALSMDLASLWRQGYFG
jgi:membrane protease YdiL (CAAX protease family)